ncbi:LGFP repeat-containing protein [Deinococcus gobiensis]|uniref:Putative antigen 85 complex protein n=1 Tax=Deinococcus gobiensis (strain DSM 21396 / JCM 16679 / CGMCC 1.7299 / I-0) TaxID=745776 RepID=H8GWF6_DEIGI|nr:putative antigen 85 complex protein [Deinococcus gobiensis]AFD25706.1 putative antigen 85 complex protein [Deinococcus gobiensis I-0]
MQHRQHRVEYRIEMRSVAADSPALGAGAVLLGEGAPDTAEVVACLTGGRDRVNFRLVCRLDARGHAQLGGRAWAGTDGRAPEGAPAFRLTLAPGEERPCTLPVAGGRAEVRLRAAHTVLGDPGDLGAEPPTLPPRPMPGAAGAGAAIRDRYEAWGGPAGPLGLPLTGVRPTPDGQGRCAHFGGGSVYWHPATGAAALLAPLRDAWAATGGERGPLGYPTADERVAGAPPALRFAPFQNGVLPIDATGAPLAPALARLEAGAVCAALGRALGRQWPNTRELGTAALVGVSATRLGARGGRVLTFRLGSGDATGPTVARSSGPGADLPLLFDAAPSPDTPGHTRLRARLYGAALFHTGGPDPHRAAGRLRLRVMELFGQPATLFEVPGSAGFLGLTVLPDGALSLAFRPDVLGRLGAQAAQGQLDDLRF